jgi:hypothetical protein
MNCCRPWEFAKNDVEAGRWEERDLGMLAVEADCLGRHRSTF